MNDSRDEGSLRNLSEDTLGFGLAEIKTARDVVIAPRTALEAWMTQGPTGGGRYARPLRLYLALNAILMLLLFLKGGSTILLTDLPAEALDPLVQRSGKSRDAFLADADGWMTLTMVPILSTAYSLVAVPMLRLWDSEDIGWLRGFRAAFAWLCAWTVPMLPFAWWAYERGPAAMWSAVAIFILGVITFMRMGKGRWYRSAVGGLFKGLALGIAIQIAALLASIPILFIGIAAAIWGA